MTLWWRGEQRDEVGAHRRRAGFSRNLIEDPGVVAEDQMPVRHLHDVEAPKSLDRLHLRQQFTLGPCEESGSTGSLECE